MIDNRFSLSQQSLLPAINKNSNSKSITNNPTQLGNSNSQFSQILERELSDVKFSQHAIQRLQSRNIMIDQAGMARLNGAVDKAAQKGAKESLVLMNNDLALVVSIKNKTVITAMDGASMKNNLFTNIDSAIII
ncbi:MAG: flagellar operon protein [Firmicutes bacterium]|nr:flagellar operon protein [Bacillota bacterium]